LKENVIIGRLIPAGTGYEGSRKHERVNELQEEIRKDEEAKQAALYAAEEAASESE